MAKDPICGMDVEEDGHAIKTVRFGMTYYFCSETCERSFLRENPSSQTPEQAHEVDDCGCG